VLEQAAVPDDELGDLRMARAELGAHVTAATDAPP